jgi:hypothetical protein
MSLANKYPNIGIKDQTKKTTTENISADIDKRGFNKLFVTE